MLFQWKANLVCLALSLGPWKTNITLKEVQVAPNSICKDKSKGYIHNLKSSSVVKGLEFESTRRVWNAESSTDNQRYSCCLLYYYHELSCSEPFKYIFWINHQHKSKGVERRCSLFNWQCLRVDPSPVPSPADEMSSNRSLSSICCMHFKFLQLSFPAPKFIHWFIQGRLAL